MTEPTVNKSEILFEKHEEHIDGVLTRARWYIFKRNGMMSKCLSLKESEVLELKRLINEKFV